MYTLLIKNATVLDGTGAPPFVADVGIENGKITKIGRGLAGAATEIDATGLTLAPGFIDSHSHSDRAVETFPQQSEKLLQGITFSITGQCGSSQTPMRQQQSGVLEAPTAYFSRIKAIKQGSYSATLIGHNTLRTAVMGSENRAPTKAELCEMKALLLEGLRAGAIGMSLGLFYTPGAYAKTDEVVALARVVAAEGGVIAAHLRDEGDSVIEAVEEFLTIIKESGCRAIFSHHKAMWRENHGKIKKTLAMIDTANAAGADIYLDVYPYLASGTTLLSRFVPGHLHPQGTTNAVSLLDDKDFCESVKAWGYQKWGKDLSFALVTEYAENTAYEGKTVADIAAEMGLADDPYEAVFRLLKDSAGAGRGVYFCIDEADLCRVLAHPRAMLCTDSTVRGNTAKFHPRVVAAFPRAIAKYTKENPVVTLPEMIRKMTSLPAHVYGLAGKGQVAEGADADLCLFDAERICDRADYINCTAQNEGIRYVILDGKIAMKDGQCTAERAACVYTKI